MSERDLKTDLHQSKRGVALLVAALVETLAETDPTFKARMLKRLIWAYEEIKDDGSGDINTLELINWTREDLTGVSMFTGQGKRLFEYYEP